MATYARQFGDKIPADQKILNEERESRLQHRYAFVVQDLATKWLQNNLCKTTASQNTVNSLRKFLEPEEDPEVENTDFVGIRQACEDFWNHCTSTPHRSETYGTAER